jgi:hypothetical protein
VHVDVAGSLVSKLKTLREKAKKWKKTLQPDRAYLNVTNQTLALIDWIEESRLLSPLDLTFKTILKRKISSLIHLVAVTPRQIGKVTWCILGDEDTIFFHSRASARLKSNKIKVIDHDGIQSFTHKEKERILMDYYRDIIGNSAVAQQLIDLQEVYPA